MNCAGCRGGWLPRLYLRPTLWWRFGCYVHEFLKRRFPRNKIDHIPIRTSRYTGINEASESVQVHGLEYIFNNATAGQSILIIDDVWDAGTTIKTVFDKLSALRVTIQVGVIYYKPTRNKTLMKPNYYIEETDKWLVFPHELEGLAADEIVTHYGQNALQLLMKE
jgi:hypoxanthine phosphoribosyltransferase